MDAIVSLVENAVSLRYEDIPLNVVTVVKKDILDTLGAILAGSAAPGCKEIVSLVRAWGGMEESTIIAYWDKVPSVNAAFVNGAMGHAIEFDDTYEMGAPLHLGASVIPAALAIGEQIGAVSGRDLITAVTLGLELMCRLSRATIMGIRGWHLTAVYGFLGGALAAAKLLGLNAEKMVDAVGIAYSQAAGNIQCGFDGTLSKRMQAGFAAKGAVLSALMAEKGITGAKNSLQGQAGLFNVYHRGEYDPEPLTSELGKKYYVEDLSFKPWPCCRYLHAYIKASLDLSREHSIQARSIEEIIVEPSLYCYPLEVKRRPGNIVDAQFSVPYAVAVAFAKGKVAIADFTEEGIRQPAVLKVAQKVTPRDNTEISDKFGKEITPAIVEVRTKGGDIYKKKVRYAYGHPKNPMSMDVLQQKFRDCASRTPYPLPPKSIQRAIDRVTRLEEMGNAIDIVEGLSEECRKE